MKTIRKVPINPVFVEFIPDILEEGKIYISKEYNATAHNCLCGCGNKTVLPLNTSALPNHGWNLKIENNGSVTLTPSVGNFQIPCKSHYIITNGIANFV